VDTQIYRNKTIVFLKSSKTQHECEKMFPNHKSIFICEVCGRTF
jgi:hypothetical protein